MAKMPTVASNWRASTSRKAAFARSVSVYGMHTSRFGYETIYSDAGSGCGELNHLRDSARIARRACDSVLDTSNQFGVSPCRLKVRRWAVSRIAVSTKRGGAARSHCRAPNHLPAAARRGRPGAGGCLRPLPGQRECDGGALDRKLERADGLG